MYTEKELIQAQNLLKENNQISILNILNKLDDNKKDKLIKQILNLNFEQLNRLYKETNETPEILDKKIEHMQYVDKYKLSDADRKLYTKLGEEIIKNNQYAVVTMAGGQGTRLGHNGPKGTFKLDVEPEAKYLFQILAENLQKAEKVLFYIWAEKKTVRVNSICWFGDSWRKLGTENIRCERV